MYMLRSLSHMHDTKNESEHMYIPRAFSYCQAKAVRELTQHVRETTSGVSEKDVGETTVSPNPIKLCL